MKQTKAIATIYAITTFILLFSLTPSAFSAENNYSSVEERRIEKTILEERATIRKEREEIGLRKKELKSLQYRFINGHYLKILSL